MYLSRLTLQIASPSVRQSLRNCQDMHKTLMQAFDCSREEACLLYRVFKTDASLSDFKPVTGWVKKVPKQYRSI